MRLIGASRFLFLALVSVSCATGQAGSVGPWASDESAIRAALQSSADAWNAGDLAGHLAVYADSVSFMTDSGPRRGVDGVEQAFRATYWRTGRPLQALRFEQLEIHQLGADAALTTARFILSGGGQPDQSGWFTLVWVRTARGWSAVHDHST